MFVPTSGLSVDQPALAVLALGIAAWWAMIGPNAFEMRHDLTTFRRRALATVAFASALALIVGTRSSPFLYFQF